MKTPFPWSRHGRQLFAGSGLLINTKRLVAKFKHEDDASTVAAFVNIRDEILATLRTDLRLLKEELDQRQLSGVPEYIEPIQDAVQRNEKAVALLERWPYRLMQRKSSSANET
jgi:hypothetical protein